MWSDTLSFSSPSSPGVVSSYLFTGAGTKKYVAYLGSLYIYWEKILRGGGGIDYQKKRIMKKVRRKVPPPVLLSGGYK